MVLGRGGAARRHPRHRGTPAPPGRPARRLRDPRRAVARNRPFPHPAEEVGKRRLLRGNTAPLDDGGHRRHGAAAPWMQRPRRPGRSGPCGAGRAGRPCPGVGGRHRRRAVLGLRRAGRDGGRRARGVGAHGAPLRLEQGRQVGRVGARLVLARHPARRGGVEALDREGRGGRAEARPQHDADRQPPLHRRARLLPAAARPSGRAPHGAHRGMAGRGGTGHPRPGTAVRQGREERRRHERPRGARLPRALGRHRPRRLPLPPLARDLGPCRAKLARPRHRRAEGRAARPHLGGRPRPALGNGDRRSGERSAPGQPDRVGDGAGARQARTARRRSRRAGGAGDQADLP